MKCFLPGSRLLVFNKGMDGRSTVGIRLTFDRTQGLVFRCINFHSSVL